MTLEALVEVARTGCPCQQAAARAEILRRLRRQILKLAHRYASASYLADDYYGEGVLGVLRAIERFDPSKGRSFATYAHWHIDGAMSHALRDCAPLLRLPGHIHERVERNRKRRDDPEAEEWERLREVVELDALRCSRDSTGTLECPDPRGLSAEQAAMLRVALGTLSAKERGALVLAADGHAFAQVGALLGVTRQRAHQLYSSAREKMREALG